MRIPWDRIYRWSRFALVLSTLIFALCALIALAAPPHYMGLYDTATYQARIVLFIIPIAAVMCALSGLPPVRQRKNRADTRMTKIMGRLTPDERDYLQQQLDDRLVALGEDGELVTLDEVEQRAKT